MNKRDSFIKRIENESSSSEDENSVKMASSDEEYLPG
jgi:hypothetical protein